MTDRREHAEAGMTVVELTVAIALLGVFIVAALGTFTSGWRGASDLDRETIRQAEARDALDALVADLRQAHTGDAAVPAVSAIASRSITFHSPDRSQPYRVRRISYRVTAAGALERSVTVSTNTGSPPWTFPGTAGAWVRLADGVQSGTIFTARDSAGVVTTTLAAIRRVDIGLSVDVGREGRTAARRWDVTVNLRSAS